MVPRKSARTKFFCANFSCQKVREERYSHGVNQKPGSRTDTRKTPCSFASKRHAVTPTFGSARINGNADALARQRVIATLGRLDRLQQSGQLEGLLQSGARFCRSALLLAAHREGRLPTVRAWRIGPVLVFERLWKELGIPEVIDRLLGGRRFRLSMQQALFVTVLHRLLVSGSDCSCLLCWRRHYQMSGAESLGLHQMYRAMARLGEELPAEAQEWATPWGPGTTKDRFEELLFGGCRDLFSELELVFFDTTSLYFEGRGARSWVGMATARTTARSGSRWSWAWCWTARGVRSVASSGRGM